MLSSALRDPKLVSEIDRVLGGSDLVLYLREELLLPCDFASGRPKLADVCDDYVVSAMSLQDPKHLIPLRLYFLDPLLSSTEQMVLQQIRCRQILAAVIQRLEDHVCVRLTWDNHLNDTGFVLKVLNDPAQSSNQLVKCLLTSSMNCLRFFLSTEQALV